MKAPIKITALRTRLKERAAHHRRQYYLAIAKLENERDENEKANLKEWVEYHNGEMETYIATITYLEAIDL